MDQDMQPQGLTNAEAARKLIEVGPNTLPETKHVGVLKIFCRQFLSPLIYILLAAAITSALLTDIKDAIFIGAVLVMNGIVGTIQEYSAEKAAAALRKFEKLTAAVLRDGIRQEIDARQLVPGDCVLLEAGRRVPADIRLLSADRLRVDESLLTGESEPTHKFAAESDAPKHRECMTFAGTMVMRGNAAGDVVATGMGTELGKIAASLSSDAIPKPPLLLRLERFSQVLAVAVFVAIVLLLVIGLLRGMALFELFTASVGLAVSAIPEGLPVAITVALAMAARRMATRHVIMRNMPAIESLGSCTAIATDKTGTLTMNQLSVTDIRLPDGTWISFETERTEEDADKLDHASTEAQERMALLLRAAILPNEASLVHDGTDWLGSGDAVDIALLTAAQRGGMEHEAVRTGHPLLSRIAYEPENKYAASFHEGENSIAIFVKGAPETLIAMAETMQCAGGVTEINREALLRQKEEMASRGLRILAFAQGEIAPDDKAKLGHGHLAKLTFLGLAGMKDPLRPEVPAAIAACQAAGIKVAMVTGDDPATAAAIARDAGLASAGLKVVTGNDLHAASETGTAALDALTREATIYARVAPLQKLDIVESLARNGHIVAVTGDGINDAPALKHAHVGVAMGKRGTDIARDSADIILTDDNFASIVFGIREGRVAYANIRKVIFMTVSTGAAEVLLFLLAIPFGFPVPLLAVQLLWLNLVTNGIQDVALATEKAEGDELMRKPRHPDEPLFDTSMLRRIALSTLFMAAIGIGLFVWQLRSGLPLDEARNILLFQFVIFENILTLCARHERGALFGRSFFSNPLLLGGVLVSQLLHIGAMFVPGLNDTLGIQLPKLDDWGLLVGLAVMLLIVLEFDKFLERKREARVQVASLDTQPSPMRRVQADRLE